MSRTLWLCVLLLIVAGCEPIPAKPVVVRQFQIEIVVKKANHKFKSVELIFNDLTCPTNGAPVHFETDSPAEISNVIRSLDEIVTELKGLEEQINTSKQLPAKP